MPPIQIKSHADLEKITRTNGLYNLTGANLSNADLPFVDLTGAILNRAMMVKAYLTGAKLQEAQFKDAKLTLADLGGANLEHANLNGADLRSTNLESANLRNANLRNANLENANLLFAKFEGADLRGANLTGAKRGNFEGARLSSNWVADEICASQQDPISLEDIPANRGFRLKTDEIEGDPDNLVNCFDATTLAQMVKNNRSLNRPLLSPLTRKPFTDDDIERIDTYISQNPSGGKHKRKSKKSRKSRKSKTKRSRKSKTKRSRKSI